MAHDWLGTFNRSQVERFLAFARANLSTIDARILHLQAEKGRIGTLVFTYDAEHVPDSVTADPTDSYLGKLLAAYEVLGGNPFLDLRSRTKGQPLFVVRGVGMAPGYISNGEPVTSKGLQDAYSAELIRSLRSPISEALRARFESLERKIRRALDYGDQLDEEVASLQVYKAAAEIEGSLEYVAEQINQLLSNRNYRAIYDDGGKDPLGLNTYAPFSAFDAENSQGTGPSRTAPGPQRQDSGYVGPGEQS